MSNTIIFEFSQQDRERLDGLSILLANLIDRLPAHINIPAPADDLTKKLADTLAKAKTNEKGTETPTEPTKADTLTDARPEEEKPTNETAQKEVTTADIRAAYMKLARTDKKEAARTLVLSYAPTIPEIPADKCAELLEKLTALEG